MPRKKKHLHLVTLFVAGALAGDVMVGCATDSSDPSLNPQPLPPKAPPEDDKTSEPEDPGSFNGGTSAGDNDGTSSSGASGSSDGGGTSSGNPSDAGGN